MRKVFILAATALMAFAAASCQKEEASAPTFTARLEQPANNKTYVDGFTIKWNGGETVHVISSNGSTSGTYSVSGVSATDPTVATLSYTGTMPEFLLVGPYKAVYSAGFISLNRIMHTVDKPAMVAESSTTNFQFHNLCGVLRVNIPQSAGVVVDRIAMTADQNIIGPFNYSGTVDEPVMNMIGEGDAYHSTDFNLATPIDLSTSGDHFLYLFLPPGTYTNVTLTFYKSQGGTCVKSCSSLTVERNKLHPVTISGTMDFQSSKSM